MVCDRVVQRMENKNEKGGSGGRVLRAGTVYGKDVALQKLVCVFVCVCVRSQSYK